MSPDSELRTSNSEFRSGQIRRVDHPTVAGVSARFPFPDFCVLRSEFGFIRFRERAKEDACQCRSGWPGFARPPEFRYQSVRGHRQ